MISDMRKFFLGCGRPTLYVFIVFVCVRTQSVVALVFQLADSSLNYLYNAVFHVLVTYMYI